MNTNPAFITRHEAAKRLSISLRYVDKLIAERKLDHYKIGKSVRFDPADIDLFLASCKTIKAQEVQPE